MIPNITHITFKKFLGKIDPCLEKDPQTSRKNFGKNLLKHSIHAVFSFFFRYAC